MSAFGEGSPLARTDPTSWLNSPHYREPDSVRRRDLHLHQRDQWQAIILLLHRESWKSCNLWSPIAAIQRSGIRETKGVRYAPRAPCAEVDAGKVNLIDYFVRPEHKATPDDR
jgi:hypothetical protein